MRKMRMKMVIKRTRNKIKVRIVSNNKMVRNKCK